MPSEVQPLQDVDDECDVSSKTDGCVTSNTPVSHQQFEPEGGVAGLKPSHQFDNTPIEVIKPCQMQSTCQETHQMRTNISGHFPIAVVGIGCRLPGGVNSPTDFWDVIANGRDTVTEIPKDRWSLDIYHNPDNKSGTHVNRRSAFVSDVFGFDNSFFKISPREAAMMDPQQRHLLEVTHEAFEDAGIVPEDLNERCGVYVGIGMIDYALQVVNDTHHINAYAHTGVAHSVAANRLSYVYNLRGPSMAVDTACASSMTSTHVACTALWNDECDIALSCGSNILLLPQITIGFSQLGVLSPEGRSCPFDESAKGYVRGEGWGTVILKPLHKALQDNDHIYSVISGSVIGDNGRNQSITMPSASAQESLMRAAYARFGIPVSQVDFVEAHGTGTPVGDPIEAQAISAVFKDRHERLKIGSVKGNFGHLECCAGITSIIKASLMLQRRTLCPTANFNKPNPHIDLDELRLTVIQKMEPLPTHKKGVIGVNSFGFGGALAHMIFEEAPALHQISSSGCGWTFGSSDVKGIPLIVPLSAKSTKSLKCFVSKWTSVESEVDAQSVVGFMSSRRTHYSKRVVFVSDSGPQFRNLTTKFETTQSSSPDVISGSVTGQTQLRICMVFPGQGQQWRDMGRQLYKTEIIFRRTVKRCDEVFETLSGYSLLHKHGVFTEANNRSTASDNVINEVEISQPSILFFQIALYSLWKYWGIKVSAFIGHSLGEVAAAYACECLSLEDAVAVIYQRSRLQAQLVGKGAMAAYRASVEDAMNLCNSFEDIHVACVNAPNSVTLAGDENIIQSITENNPTLAKRLRVKCAFHTPHMEPMKDEFLQSIVIHPRTSAKASFYSTVTGKLVDGKLDAKYWWDNIRHPVNFLSATKAVLQDENIDMFIECSASPTLMSCVSQTAKQLQITVPTVVTSCQRQKDDRLSLLRSLANVYVNGGEINWSNVNNNKCQWVPLPSYAWEHVSFQEESDTMRKKRLGLFDRTFKGQNGMMSVEFFPYLADHMINGTMVFPGAGYVEYALQTYCGDDAEPCLENINFRHVLILDENTSTKLDISTNGSIVQMTSENGLHAEAIISHSESKPFKLPLDEIRERCKENIDVKEIYSCFKDIGLAYGTTFQVLDELNVTKGEAYAFVSCPKNGERLHVATLDGCFQLALVAAGLGTTIYLPVKIDKMKMFVHTLPSDQQLVAYAMITNHSFDVIKADIIIANESGHVLVDVQGFEAKNVSGTYSDVDIGTCLYTTEWQPKTSCLPSTEIATAIFTQEHLIEQYPEELEAISKVEPYLTTISDIAVAYAQHALNTVSCEERHPRNERYIRQLEKIVVEHAGERDACDRETTLASLRQQLPEMAVELIMFERLGNILPETLKDPSVALPILFAADALATYFIDSLTTRLYYKAGAEIVSKAVKEVAKHKSIIRILEVGGRMGGLARHMLKACSHLSSKGRLEYVFTDLNTTFFAHAKQTLSDYPNVKYQQLDIEKDVSQQGFVPGTFDIVICMDTLHSVVNISEGLTNMTDLLCDDGWMMMYEATKGYLVCEILFGSLELCWVYNDERTDTCWLSQREWCDAFTRHGLRNVVGVSSPKEFFHSIILGQKITTAAVKQMHNQDERWIVAHHSQAPAMKVVTTALSAHLVDTCNVDKHSGVTDHIVNDAGSSNIVYLWEKCDITLKTTIKLIKDAYASSSKIDSFWILTCLGNKESTLACAGLAIGCARVLCNEIPNFPIFSIDVDRKALSALPAVVEVLSDIFRRKNSPDRELVLRDLEVMVPRLVKNNMLQHKMQSAGRWRLELPTGAKHVEDIKFYDFKPAAYPDNHAHVLVRVNATAVNFKDVMMTTGLLDGLNISPQFGLECSGVVVETYGNVMHIEVGDEVIAFGDQCFASHVVCDSNLVVKKPDNISQTDAAGVAIVFSTAYHALIERARLRKGEIVLIHSACGGVGQAAIQIAKLVGARVFCSAGSTEKRDYLKHQCKVEMVTDSHSLAFAEDIRQWTDNVGVDVILNCLSGDFIKKGIEVLKPGGRFCEIGKRDILSNNSLHMLPLLENKSFMSIQMDILMKDKPSAMKHILCKVCSLLQDEFLKPIPTTVKSISEYNETFKWMMSGMHIGKIVFDIAGYQPDDVFRAEQCFKPDVTYLVTGGMGGIGQAMIRWMVEKGARHIAIVSRNGCKTRLQRCTLNYLETMGCTVYEQEFRADVSSKTEVGDALSLLLGSAPTLKGIFHLAAIIDDSTAVTLTDEALSRGIKAKAYGAFNLHQCTKHLDLDYFVMVSSISSVCGNPEQANYCAANAYLDALATKRRNEGLVALSIQIGAVRGAGFLEGKAKASKIVQSKGFKSLHIAEYLDMFGKLLRQADVPPVVALANMEWESTLQFCHKNMMKFRHLVNPSKMTSGAQSVSKEDLEDKFISKLGDILYVSNDSIDTSRPMIDYGVDSLMAVDLVNWVNKEFGLNISQLDILGGMTTASLLEKALSGKVVISF